MRPLAMYRFTSGMLLLGLAACTPDRIVYHHADVLGGQKDVVVIREDGSNKAVVASSLDEEVACGVTTDGRLVFTRYTANGGDLYVVREDGSGLTPLRVTADDESCFGVTGNNMVIFGVTVTEINHDLYSVSVNAAPSDSPMTLSATAVDELPMAIGWDNRVVYAKQDVVTPIDGHRYSYNSVNDDGSLPSHVVGVFEEPRFVAIGPGHRMVWTRPGPPPNGGLFSTTTTPPITTTALNQFLHNLGWVEDRFCGFTPKGRLILTSRGVYPVDGIPTWFGMIYAMDEDGGNRVRINPGPRSYNELCLGGTDTFVVVGRYPDTQDPSRGGPVSIWSYPMSGSGNPTRLAQAASSEQFALSFEGISPQGRVLFRTYDSATQTEAHHSINADGSGLVTLTSAHGLVNGLTTTKVVYSVQGQQYDLAIVPDGGQSPVATLAGDPTENWVGFVYRSDFLSGRLVRCRVCWPGSIVDRGGIPIPSPLPPP